ncbi:MAG TPA: SDR family oxidoreductase [Solirubrobacteraceae bacterium]|jgi:NADP-dependent 3-hydroxy acid dehydrogenase YdfG
MTAMPSQPGARTADGLLGGRVAAVTGATSGIGAATVERLAFAGARVALLGRREQRLRALAERITSEGGTAIAVPADVGDNAALTSAAERIAAELGTVDLLVNNAGVMLPGEITSQPISDWQRMIDTNLVGALYAIRALLPRLIEAAASGGAADLVNVSSIGGKLVFPRYAVYGATKAALSQLSAMLRAELSPRGVRVTDLQPGLTESELAGNVTDPDSRAGLEQMFDGMQALRASDVADLILYVVSRPAHVNVSTLDIVPTAQA